MRSLRTVRWHDYEWKAHDEVSAVETEWVLRRVDGPGVNKWIRLLTLVA